MGVEEGFLEEVVSRLGPEDFIGTASCGGGKERNMKGGWGEVSQQKRLHGKSILHDDLGLETVL